MAPRWLLATDVDDTLLGDDAALERFISATEGSPLLVVLNSSRPVASVAASVRSLETPPPIGGIVGALGTEIELDGERVSAWSTQFTDFDRAPIDIEMARRGAIPHDGQYQTSLKASYAIAKERWREAADAVTGLGVPVQVITSGETNFDVIPAAAGKAAATRYVAATLGIPTERTVTAGDSENDADLVAAGNGIIVGNATDELRSMVGDAAYHAAQPRADGILEGLRHHGVPLDGPTISKEPDR